MFEKATGKGHGAKSPATPASRLPQPERDYGRWSAMFPKFGGRGGF